MSDFRFAEPGWVHALWVLAGFTGLLFWLERRGGSALERLVSPRLQHRLVQRPAASSRRLSQLLIGLSAAFLILALMRPQWGLHYVPAARVGAEIMVCLDVSKSMLAEDVAPNRLERAKAEIRDLLPYLDGDYVGLLAFAGRASVLSPLTPDFGFLRLVLDGVGVQSVTRGGTRLEEPIRKALKGFGSAGDLSRAILLITDGEDHDSFPLDAAKAAAELGVRIIAIGFGEEAGSEVTLTDRETGARTRLTDASGRPVRTRLDGETLRQIALETGGAYVPAGTGILDLESIYRTHIAPLQRGALEGRGRATRYEGYQWAVLLGLVSLVLSVGVAGRSRRLSIVTTEASRRAAALLMVSVLAAGTAARADTAASATAPDSAPQPESVVASESEGETPEDSREIYNQGLRALRGNSLDEAASRLTTARSLASHDGELRYRATFNLGLTAAKQAEQSLEADPETALKHLHVAADWFREAVRLRPEAEDPRHNLEVVLQRVLVLTDALSEQDSNDLGQELDELAGQERALVAQLRENVERIAAEPGPNVVDGLRREFRGLAATQRTILSDADGLASRVGAEHDAIQAQPEQERSPEDAMRLVQLENLQHYLHRARERMGQARSRLRERQAERAYRRGSAALAELRRAQDQLRGPVQVLDGVIGAATELAHGTARLAADLASLPNVEAPPDPPAWLTSDYLRDEQQSIGERTSELRARLGAGMAAEPDPSGGADSAQLLAMVREAEPLVAEGEQAFERAHAALLRDDLEQASAAQVEAIRLLLDARERFLDLRSLIETAHADQARIRAALHPEEEGAQLPPEEMLPEVRALQAKNVARGERLANMIEAEKARVESAAAGEATEELELNRKRLSTAQALLKLTREAMQGAQQAMGELDSPAGDLSAAGAAAVRASEGFSALRQLFFSIVEHLQETARRQLAVNDQTQDAAAAFASSPEAGAAKLGPLLPRQEQIAEFTAELADALEQQSRENAGALVRDPNLPAGGGAEMEEVAQRLRRAGELVLGAHGEMSEAARGLAAEPPEFEPSREHQDAALVQLAQAIQLLTPPPPQEATPQSPESDERDEASGQEGAEQEDSGEGAPKISDPAHLLQAVRDREAQRQRELAGRAQSGYETVEKDW